MTEWHPPPSNGSGDLSANVAVLPIPPVMRASGTAVEAWLRYQDLRGFSPRTIERRAMTLRRFAAVVVPRAVLAATADDVEALLRSVRSVRSRHAYLSDLRGFFRWALSRGYAVEDPTVLVDGPRVPKSLPRPLDRAAAVAAFDAAPAGRVRRAVGLALFAGLRRSEIAGLEWADVVAHPPMVVVRSGKGAKDRAVPLHDRLVDELDGGGSGLVIGWSAHTVGLRVAEHLRGCGIVGTCHSLRHTFATEVAYRANGNLLVVAALCGHDSVTTSQGYAKLAGGLTTPVMGALFGQTA